MKATKADNELKIIIPLACEGNCSEKMTIQTLDWGDDNIDIYISFSIDSFYAGQSVIGILKERIKLAWLALRKGNYIHNEILTNTRAMSELNVKLSEMLERIEQNRKTGSSGRTE